MFLTESTSDNSGHTAPLCSAQIRQSRTSFIHKPLYAIGFGTPEIKTYKL